MTGQNVLTAPLQVGDEVELVDDVLGRPGPTWQFKPADLVPRRAVGT